MLMGRFSETADEIDLFGLVATIWRGKFWIILAAIVSTLLGGYYAYFTAVPMYTSRAMVALESRQEQVVDIESVVTGLSGDQASINTEVEVLRSRGLAKKLVARLNLLEDPEFNTTLIEDDGFSLRGILGGLRSRDQDVRKPDERAILESTINRVLDVISISNVRQSYVFQITAVTTSPTRSADIANELARLYILDQLEVKFEATEQATNWLTERVSQLKTELEESESKVKTFDAGTELVSAEALAALNRQLKEIRDRVGEADLAQQAASETLSRLQSAANTGDMATMEAAAEDRTLSRVYDLIKQGSAEDDAFEARYNQILDRAQLDKDRAQAQMDALNGSITDLERRIGKQSADLVELQQLQREAEASRLIYEYFLGRLKETSVQQGIQQADSRILSEAVIPTSPSAPRKSMILALSMILGLVAGTGAVLVREFMQNTFRTAEELEQFTGYTVMGSIPVIPAADRTKVLEYIQQKPTSQAAEAIRNLRTSILLSNVDKPPKIIMSTSSVPSEGKTTQSILLAMNFAALGNRVLLIEGDIRRRVFSNYLNVKNTVGLVSVLSGDASVDEAIQRDDRMGVDVLIGEKPKINAADLYASERFETFLQEMRSHYDLIVIDTPPVLVVPDSRVIGQFVDAIIYTVKWDETQKSQVTAGLAMFESVGLKVTGLTLGQVDAKGIKKYGLGGYGSYGAGYSGYYEN